MAKQPVTPAEMAAHLVGLFPPPLTSTRLEEYRLERAASKVVELTRELLSLGLFWVSAGLEAHYRGIGDVLVLPEVERCLEQRWHTTYGFGPAEWASFLAQLPDRLRAYGRVQDEGGGVLDLSTDAAVYLEEEWVIGSSDRDAALALIVDLVAVDAIDRVFEQVELVAPQAG